MYLFLYFIYTYILLNYLKGLCYPCNKCLVLLIVAKPIVFVIASKLQLFNLIFYFKIPNEVLHIDENKKS